MCVASAHWAFCCPVLSRRRELSGVRAVDRSKCWLLLLWLLPCSSVRWAQGLGSGFLGFSLVGVASFALRDVGLPLLLHVSLHLKSFGLTHAQHRWSLWEALLHFEEFLAGACETVNCFPKALTEFGWVSTHRDNQGNSPSFRPYNGQNANIHEEGGTHLGAAVLTFLLSVFWLVPASLAVPVICASRDNLLELLQPLTCMYIAQHPKPAIPFHWLFFPVLLLHLLHISATLQQCFLLSSKGQLCFSSPLCKEISAPGKESMNWVVCSCGLCHKRSQKMGGRFLLSLWIPKIYCDPNRWILFLNAGVQLWSASSVTCVHRSCSECGVRSLSKVSLHGHHF